MGGTRVKGKLIEDGTIQRVDVDTSTSGQALITRVIAGTGVTISSTGTDTGTGDVTINAGTSEYISNYNAEVNTTGWSNSGSNFTISRTTTGGEVLRGTASFKLTANGSQAVNDYISTSFTLDPGDVNTPLALQFYFKGISNYDSGDVEVVLHDGTNEILPSITAIPGGGPGFFEAIWISNSNTSYTLRFKAKVTTAFSISIDEVFVRRKEVVQGAAISKFVPEAGFSFSSGFGTVTGTTAFSARVGDSFKFHMTATAGTISSTVASVLLPSGVTVDYAKYPTSVSSRVGTFTQLSNTANYTQNAVLFVDGTTTDRLFICYTQNLGDYNKDNVTALLTSGYTFEISGEVHTSGWSADVVLQNAKVEYGSNTSTNDGDDTTTFSLETYGAVIPAVTALYKKRIQFAYPIAQTDEIEIQADWDGQGIWNRWEDQGYDNVEGKFGPTWEYVSGSKYQIDVWMRGNHHARFQNSTANFRSYTQENSAGSRWRVRKTANPLAVEAAHIVETVNLRDEKSSGTDGGTATTTTWTDSTINTLDNPNGYGWISLSSNQFTLKPGTYEIIAWKTFYRTDGAEIRLYSVTGSVVSQPGNPVITTNSASTGSAKSTVEKSLTISSDTTFKIQYYVETSNSSTDLGRAMSLGTVEIYSNVQVRKLA